MRRSRSDPDIRHVGTASTRTPWTDPDRDWLETKGAQIQYYVALEEDLAAMHEFNLTLATGTTLDVPKAKELATKSKAEEIG